MELSTTPSVKLSPILSVNVPIHAHCLCKDTLREPKQDVLHSLLHSLDIHCVLESHLDTNSPLCSITQIYIQNQQLKSLLDLTSFPSSIRWRCNTLCIIQWTIQEDLFSIFHQLPHAQICSQCRMIHSWDDHHYQLANPTFYLLPSFYRHWTSHPMSRVEPRSPNLGNFSQDTCRWPTPSQPSQIF